MVVTLGTVYSLLTVGTVMIVGKVLSAKLSFKNITNTKQKKYRIKKSNTTNTIFLNKILTKQNTEQTKY